MPNIFNATITTLSTLTFPFVSSSSSCPAYNPSETIPSQLNAEEKLETNTFVYAFSNDDVSAIASEICRKNMYTHSFNRLCELLCEADEKEDELISFWKTASEKIYFEDFFEWSFLRLNPEHKYFALSSILSSDIDVFQKWFVESLRDSAKSENKFLSSKAKNIYDLYFDLFEKI